ncbi:hypothetical protein R6Q59_004961 [Mikania micrantha]
MGKRRRSLMLQKLSNLIKTSIFIAKMRLIRLKKSTKFSVSHINSYGFLQERQFSPSSTPLISRKKNRSLFYSVCFLSCFNRGDESYSMESALADQVDRDCFELSYGEEEEEEEEECIDERAEIFIERFYQEIKRQRRESANLICLSTGC